MSERLDPAAFVGAVIAGTGLLAGLADWTTRPPCPEGYVRLIDVVPIAAVICGAFTVMLVWRAARTTPWARQRKEVRGRTMVTSVGLTVLTVLPALLAVASYVQHRGQTIDNGCWTF
jgi:hypothetical protein